MSFNTLCNVIVYCAVCFTTCIWHLLLPRVRFRVFTVPEAATTMFTNGITLQDLDHAKYAFQWSILQ